MTEKWLIAPGEERVIDIENVSRLKIGLVGGQVDVIAHDEPGIRIEVHGVTIKDLRIESHDGEVEIDHPQLGWDNFLEVFRNFGSGGPKAEVSVAVPRSIALNLGVVSAGALVSGIRNDARLNTVSGDIIVDTLIPGRLADLRESTDAEIGQTAIVELSLDEVSAKMRTGGPKDEPEDMDSDVWAGVVPFSLQPGEPMAADDLKPGPATPDYLKPYRR